MAASKVSEWLNETVHSHGLYGIDVLRTLPAPVTYDKSSDELRTPDRSVRLGARSAEWVRKNEGAVETGNPKGAYVDDDVDADVQMFAGYELSYALDVVLTGSDGASHLMGRGFRFRANVAHIEEAGE